MYFKDRRMAQEFEQIISLLDEIKKSGNKSSKEIDKLLSTLSTKIDSIEQNSASEGFVKACLTDVTKLIENKYTVTGTNFENIENSIKSLIKSNDKNIKTEDIRELFDIFSKNLNNFYTESLQQKSILNSIENKISNTSSDKFDKEEILRTITLVRSDLEKLNQNYKISVEGIVSDLKTIISNILKIDRSAVTEKMNAQLESVFTAVTEIVNYLKKVEKHEINLENILQSTATAESLKITQISVDSLISKSESIYDKLNDLSEKQDIKELSDEAEKIKTSVEQTATKEQLKFLTEKTEDLTAKSDEIKKTLATITKNIDSLPKIEVLKDSLQNLYNELKEVEDAVAGTSIKGNIKEIESNLKNFSQELDTVKKIIVDLNEVVTSKLLNAVSNISFEKESYEIKEHVSKMIEVLPQMDDVEKILEKNELNKDALDKLLEKADILADKLDALPTHSDMEGLNNNQLSLVENLQEVATKTDIENLASKSDEIEEMIDKLNFDNEFQQLYDKSSSIENWLIDSKIKDNTADILATVENKAEQKSLIQVLKSVEKIADDIEELSNNTDIKKVNHTVADVYQIIEDLKTDFINTSEMHNDSVIVNLSELQRSVENIVTGDEFDKFVEDLKDFVNETINSLNKSSADFQEIKDSQKVILEKLEGINLPNFTDEKLEQKIDSIDSKILTLSEFVKNSSQEGYEELSKSISEIKEIISSKKSNLDNIDSNNQTTVQNISDYLKEIKIILDTVDNAFDSDVKDKIQKLEENIQNYYDTARQDQFDDINSKLDGILAFRTDFEEKQKISTDTLTELNLKTKELSEAFSTLCNKDSGNTKDNDSAKFVSDMLENLSNTITDLKESIEQNLQAGFAYNSELAEEKTSALIDFIRELRHESTENIELFERLTVTDNKLTGIKQDLERVNEASSVNLNNAISQITAEFAPIKQMLFEIKNSPSNLFASDLKEQVEEIHDESAQDVEDVTKFSQTTYKRLESLYRKISYDLTNSENNLKDFILSDIDSVIIKLDSLESAVSSIELPDSYTLSEFKEFISNIENFKQEQKEQLEKIAQDIKESISEQLSTQHEELKSLLTVSVNNEEIISAIEELKNCFKSKMKALEESEDAIFDTFESGDGEKEFENDKNEVIISEIKADFDKFTDLIKDLSGNNNEIEEVLSVIKKKMDTLSVVGKDIPEIANKIDDADFEIDAKSSDYDETDDYINELDNSDENKTIVGVGNFDFIKALDLLKHDVNTLNDNVKKILPEDEQNISSIPKLGKDNLILSLNNKIEHLAEIVNPGEWLDEIKKYLAGDEIHTMLEKISGKIDILTLSDNTEWIMEIKQALDQLNNPEVVDDPTPELKAMLNLISSKIDVLASSDDYELIEEVRDAISNIDAGSNEDFNKLLNSISTKIDVLASTDSTEDFEDLKDSIETISGKIDVLASTDNNIDDILEIKESISALDEKIEEITNASDLDEIKDYIKKLEDEIKNIGDKTTDTSNLDDIKYTLLNVDEKVDSVKKLSEADAKITSILEDLNHKVDKISDVNDLPLATLQEISDIKDLIMAQTDYINRFEKNNKTDAVRKCLQELTDEVNSLNSTSGTKTIQKTIKEMKESIMAAVVTIVDQVSFVEESEDIKDFVEEKTDEINRNLNEVTNQLKQITSANEEPDYTYSMQDIESDLAKMRLALNELQTTEQENQAVRLNSILQNISQIGESVDTLQNSLTQEEVFGLKNELDNINQLIKDSSSSYNALSSSFEDFGKNITSQLISKVESVEKMLIKSNDSDKVMRQALIYMGEWIDSASDSMNKISANSEEIADIKSAIEKLKKSIPEQTDILNSIEEKFDEQQERLAYFEKQISKIGDFEDKFEQQQERIDRLEMSLDKILSAVEDIDDSKVTRKIDKIDKQIAKLSTNIEKLTSYVD